MDLLPAPLLLLLSMLLLLRQQAGALRLLNVTVPPYLKRGESTRLECRYELGQDKLYSVSWYKDNDHIYSFLGKHAKKQVYPMDGVKIDVHKSNGQQLALTSVNLNSTGWYACEVNTDSPFKSVKGDAYMEVVEPPRDDPEITIGEEKIYATGDTLALNCTSGFSYPPAQLQWFINDLPVAPESEVVQVTSRGLHSSRSSLRLELDPFHLINGRIGVKCVSTMSTSPQVRKALVDKRTKAIFVQGEASLAAPSVSLLLVVLLLLLRQD